MLRKMLETRTHYCILTDEIAFLHDSFCTLIRIYLLGSMWSEEQSRTSLQCGWLSWSISSWWTSSVSTSCVQKNKGCTFLSFLALFFSCVWFLYTFQFYVSYIFHLLLHIIVVCVLLSTGMQCQLSRLWTSTSKFTSVVLGSVWPGGHLKVRE